MVATQQSNAVTERRDAVAKIISNLKAAPACAEYERLLVERLAARLKQTLQLTGEQMLREQGRAQELEELVAELSSADAVQDRVVEALRRRVQQSAQGMVSRSPIGGR